MKWPYLPLDKKQLEHLEEEMNKVKKLLNRLPHIPSSVARFLRVVVGAGLAAAMTAGITNVGELPISDTGTTALLTAGLVALDKYLRDKGVY